MSKAYILYWSKQNINKSYTLTAVRTLGVPAIAADILPSFAMVSVNT